MDPDFKSFLDELGIPDPKSSLVDEEPPEPVDEDRILAFYRRELPDAENEWIAFLITRYRPWHEADVRLTRADGVDPSAVETKRTKVGTTSPQGFPRRSISLVLATAASLLFVAGFSWAVLSNWGAADAMADPLAEAGEVVRTKDGEVRNLATYPESWRQAVSAAVSEQSVGPLGKALDFVSSTMGVGDGAVYVGPVNTVVRETRPTFRWRNFGTGRGYRVTLVGTEITSPILDRTAWTPEQELSRGEVYTWEVSIPRDDTDEDLPPDKRHVAFQILSQEKLEVLERLEAAAKGSHLLLGVAYKEFGLLDDALHEFRRLAEVNPKSASAKKLLASMEHLR